MSGIDLMKSSQVDFVRKMMKKKSADTKEDNYTRFCQRYNLFIFFANDEAGLTLFDATSKLKRSPLYKQKVKYLSNKAQAAYDRYEKNFRSMFDNKEYLKVSYSLYDKYQDYISPHIGKLRLSILSVLTRLEVPEREMLSYVLTASCMLDIATETVKVKDMMIKKLCGPNIRWNMSVFSVEGVCRIWHEVLDLLVPQKVQKEVFNDSNGRLAYTVIVNKANDFDTIEGMATEIVQENRDFMLTIVQSEEERQLVLNS